MRVVVIEDELPAARRLVKLIQEVEPAIQVVAQLESVSDSVEWFTHNAHPDLIFSDIQLSDNLSFEIFKQVAIKTPIIFTTAYDQYAIQAFEHLSLDYLLKPIRSEHLRKAISKLKQLQQPSHQWDPETLIGMMRKASYRDRFLVYSGSNLISIPSSEVAYFYSEDGASFLQTISEKKYLMSDSLDKIEASLDPLRFFRANRQFIVSIESVVKVAPYFNQKLKVFVQPESEVIVSKLKATEFKNWLNS